LNDFGKKSEMEKTMKTSIFAQNDQHDQFETGQNNSFAPRKTTVFENVKIGGGGGGRRC
jgi:hypothetical protein